MKCGVLPISRIPVRKAPVGGIAKFDASLNRSISVFYLMILRKKDRHKNRKREKKVKAKRVAEIVIRPRVMVTRHRVTIRGKNLMKSPSRLTKRPLKNF